MIPLVEILGVHPIKAKEPCHLFELVIHGNEARIDFAKFTQEWPGKEQSSWQVAYLERFLEADGGEIQLKWMLDLESAQFWRRDIRLAFFFHYLRFDRPLLTPYAPVALPSPTPRPERLKFMKYALP